MNNKYEEYSPEDFTLYYPYEWELRNKKYLEKRDDRETIIVPIGQYINDNGENE